MHRLNQPCQHYTDTDRLRMAILTRNMTKNMKRNMTSKIKAAALLITVMTLSACGSVGSLDFPGVYKIGIPQGNIITQEMVDQLRPGMTKRQVIFVMGTPLVRDPYNQDRWDYIYSFQPGGGVRGQEKITVFFEDDALVQMTGDFSPSESASDTASAETTPAESDS